MNATTKTVVGVDTAKSVFQLHWVDVATGEVKSKQLKRAKFLEHFANLTACLIGMEACGGSHHWARKLTAMGHEVKLLPGKFVKAFVCGNKNDAGDARAIWLAVQQPSMRAVAVKTEAQQAVLALHRMRQQLVKFRTMQSNGLRGLLMEFGEVMPVGRAALNAGMPEALKRLAEHQPAALIETMREQWNALAHLDLQVKQIEMRLEAWKKQDKACVAISQIPGVGLLTATAAVATMGDPKAFKSGREFAAWLGLVPGQVGTGGKTRLTAISKRGDSYLRTLLVHAARAVLFHAKDPGEWLTKISARRPGNVVVVALANKIARTIWAVLAYNRPYAKDHVSMKPA